MINSLFYTSFFTHIALLSQMDVPVEGQWMKNRSLRNATQVSPVVTMWSVLHTSMRNNVYQGYDWVLCVLGGFEREVVIHV
jgi:hypothetical protein